MATETSARRPLPDVAAKRHRAIVSGGIRWHVQIQGSGPALLLLHGTGASSDSFGALMPLLAQRFTVIAPDLPGHAGSTAAATFEPSLPAMAAALGELLGALDVTPVMAVGHSAGGALVVRMTLDGIIAPELLVGIGAAMFPLRGCWRSRPGSFRFESAPPTAWSGCSGAPARRSTSRGWSATARSRSGRSTSPRSSR